MKKQTKPENGTLITALSVVVANTFRTPSVLKSRAGSLLHIAIFIQLVVDVGIMNTAIYGRRRMTLKQTFDIIVEILKTMQNGEIRLFIKNREIKHVNRTEEVFPGRESLTKF